MKNNRRDFIKKNASLAATMSIGGIGSAVKKTIFNCKLELTGL
jgi:hypothetical protein